MLLIRILVWKLEWMRRRVLIYLFVNMKLRNIILKNNLKLMNLEKSLGWIRMKKKRQNAIVCKKENICIWWKKKI